MTLRQTAFRDPRSYFTKYAEISDAEALQTAERLWSRINCRICARTSSPRASAPA